jgi:hypothetical protein
MTDKWIRDTGLVFAAFFLLIGTLRHSGWALWLSLAFLVVLLFVPKVLTPLAWVWLKVAEILGLVMNKVFFGLVFYIVVVPVGLLRRILKGDARDLALQPDRETAFVERGKTVEAADLAKPY